MTWRMRRGERIASMRVCSRSESTFCDESSVSLLPMRGCLVSTMTEALAV